MTSDNKTVSRQNKSLWAGNSAKYVTSEGNSALLPTNVDRRPLLLLPLHIFLFVLYNKSLNDWSLRKQFILFSSGPVIKCLVWLASFEVLLPMVINSRLNGDGDRQNACLSCNENPRGVCTKEFNQLNVVTFPWSCCTLLASFCFFHSKDTPKIKLVVMDCSWKTSLLLMDTMVVLDFEGTLLHFETSHQYSQVSI